METTMDEINDENLLMDCDDDNCDDDIVAEAEELVQSATQKDSVEIECKKDDDPEKLPQIDETLSDSQKETKTDNENEINSEIEDKLLESSIEEDEVKDAETLEKSSEDLTVKESDLKDEVEVKKLDEVENENPKNETQDEDDLLISCEAPKKIEEDQQVSDDSSSNADDNEESKNEDNLEPEESKSDENLPETEVSEENDQEMVKSETIENDENEVDSKKGIEKVEMVKIEMVKEEDIKKEKIELNFLRRFASATGKLSRSDLEELLLEKVTDCFLYTSENASLRHRIEKQEKTFETLKARIDTLKKQYNDLDMIHKRVMRDLEDRPGQPIVPVKITRAVGLQVYQPSQTLKRKNEEIIGNLTKTTELKVTTPDQKRRKVTPLRAPLTDTQKKAIEQKSLIESQLMKADITKNLLNSTSVTLTARKSTNVSSAIDLTDEDDTPSSNTVNYNTPPALVAINQRTGQRGFIAKAPATTVTRILPKMPLLISPAPVERPGWKKFPPKPIITILKTAQKNGIVVQWRIDGYDSKQHAIIKSYEIYAYEHTSNQTAQNNWRKVGNVSALPLPMAITLTQFSEGLFGLIFKVFLLFH